jgi:hypothetical protein
VHPWKTFRDVLGANRPTVARDERWTRLTCDHKGIYADDVRFGTKYETEGLANITQVYCGPYPEAPHLHRREYV